MCRMNPRRHLIRVDWRSFDQRAILSLAGTPAQNLKEGRIQKKMGKLAPCRNARLRKSGNFQMANGSVTLKTNDQETAISDDQTTTETDQDSKQDAKNGIWRSIRNATPEHWHLYAKMADGSIHFYPDVFVANPTRVADALKKVRMSQALFDQLPNEAKAVILKNGSAVRVAPTTIETLPSNYFRFAGESEPAKWINAEVKGTARVDLISKMIAAFQPVADHHDETPDVKIETALQACGVLWARPNDEKNGKGFLLSNVKLAEKDRIIRELANASLGSTVLADDDDNSDNAE